MKEYLRFKCFKLLKDLRRIKRNPFLISITLFIIGTQSNLEALIIAVAVVILLKFRFITLLFLIFGFLYSGIFATPILDDVEEGIVISIERTRFTEQANIYLTKKNTSVLAKLNKVYKAEVGDLIEFKISSKKKQSDFYTSQNIHYQVGVLYLEKKGEVEILKFMNRIRESIKSNFINNYTESTSSLLTGLSLGDESQFKKEIIEDFNNSSLRHIISFSGSNLMIIYFVIFSTGRLINRRILNMAILAILPTILLVVGLSNLGALRATIMLLVFTLCSILGKQRSVLTSILISLLIFTLIYPQLLTNLSVHLSFLALTGIILFSEKISFLFKRLRITGSVTNIVSPTIAATISTLPLSFLTFGKISGLGIVANILVAPITSILTVASYLSIFLNQVQILEAVSKPSTEFFSKYVFTIANIFNKETFLIKDTPIALLFFLILIGSVVLGDYFEFKETYEK